MSSETAVVARACRGEPQKILILVDRLNDRRKEHQEQSIIIRIVSGLKQILTRIRGY